VQPTNDEEKLFAILAVSWRFLPHPSSGRRRDPDPDRDRDLDPDPDLDLDRDPDPDRDLDRDPDRHLDRDRNPRHGGAPERPLICRVACLACRE
jgi:hypothetical protein